MDIIGYMAKLSIPDGGEHPRVKAALLKFFWDKGFYFDVKSCLDEIFSDFTLDRMISLWAGREISVYPEESVSLSEASREILLSVLRNRELSMTASGTGIIGRIYEKSLDGADRKAQGVTYTPEDVCDYVATMLRGKISPDVRFIDPACGCGTFLEIFYDGLIRLMWEDGGEENISTVHERILRENIFGCDSSAYACAVSKITLALKYRHFVLCENIYNIDSLTDLPEELLGTFDIVSSNPPYIGHKTIDKSYRAVISRLYPEVYYNKADISYCFFVTGHRLLREGGILLYISSRYFTQSRYADGLRRFILDSFRIRKVIDFYGSRPFRDTGIDPLIILLSKGAPEGEYTVNTVRFIPSSSGADDILDSPSVEIIKTPVSLIGPEGFNFLSASQLELKRTVEEKSSLRLADVCDLFQGAITGCDRAFVTTADDPAAGECGRKWIKSSCIKRDGIEFRGQYVLYTDSLEDMRSAPNTLKRLEGFRERLSSRRECREGRREWYQLQWGRRPELFDSVKIVFPYKSSDCRFAVDREGYCFSADVYGMVPRREYEEVLDLDRLAMLLNSPIYSRYFFTFAKKLGGTLYEFYPNTVGEMLIPAPDIIRSFRSEEDIIEYFSEG